MKKAPAPKTIYQIALWLAGRGEWSVQAGSVCVRARVCFGLSVAGVTHSSQGT